MIELNDDADVPIVCNKCGHKFSKTLGWLKSNDKFSCPGCSKVTFQSKKLVRELQETVDAATEKFRRDLGLR